MNPFSGHITIARIYHLLIPHWLYKWRETPFFRSLSNTFWILPWSRSVLWIILLGNLLYLSPLFLIIWDLEIKSQTGEEEDHEDWVVGRFLQPTGRLLTESPVKKYCWDSGEEISFLLSIFNYYYIWLSEILKVQSYIYHICFILQ